MDKRIANALDRKLDAVNKKLAVMSRLLRENNVKMDYMLQLLTSRSTGQEEEPLTAEPFIPPTCTTDTQMYSNEGATPVTSMPYQYAADSTSWFPTRSDTNQESTKVILSSIVDQPVL